MSSSASVSALISIRSSSSGALLFRPDRLEENLAVRPGALFPLTRDDRAKLNRANALAPRPNRHPGATSSEHRRHTSRAGQRAGSRRIGGGHQRAAPGCRSRQERRTSPRNWRDPLERGARGRASRQLLPGRNVVGVAVSDSGYLSDSRKIEVDYNPRVARKPRLWLGVIATRDYDHDFSRPRTHSGGRTHRPEPVRARTPARAILGGACALLVSRSGVR